MIPSYDLCEENLSNQKTWIGRKTSIKNDKLLSVEQKVSMKSKFGSKTMNERRLSLLIELLKNKEKFLTLPVKLADSISSVNKSTAPSSKETKLKQTIICSESASRMNDENMIHLKLENSNLNESSLLVAVNTPVMLGWFL